MPRKPRRPCGHPGCPRLAVEGGQYCEEHTKTERDRYNRYERAPDVNKKYGRAWKRIRDRYAAAHPLCEMCLKEGRLTLWRKSIISFPFHRAATTGRAI